MVDTHHKPITQRFVFSKLHVLEEYSVSSARIASAQMFKSAQEQQEKVFTPGNSQTQLGTKESARLAQLWPFTTRDVSDPLVQLDVGSCPWTRLASDTKTNDTIRLNAF